MADSDSNNYFNSVFSEAATHASASAVFGSAGGGAKNIGTSMRIALFCCLLVIGIVVSFFVYNFALQRQIENHQKAAAGVLTMAAGELGRHLRDTEAVVRNAESASAAYFMLNARLREIQDLLKLSRLYYLERIGPAEYALLLDSAWGDVPVKHIDFKSTHTAAEFDPNMALENVYFSGEAGSPAYISGTGTDAVMRVYQPIAKLDGTVAGILCCDYNVSFMDRLRKTMIFWAAVSVVLAALITFILSYSLSKLINSVINEQMKASNDIVTIKNNYLSNMNHEIRAPLQYILGICDIVRTDNFDALQKSQLENIKHITDTILGITNNILDYSKIKSGTIELCNVHYNIKILFENITALFAIQAESCDLNFKSSFDINLPLMLYGDEKRVRQICTNLLSNAVKFTGAGGSINLRFEKSKAHSGDEFIIRVSDTGVGIKPEQKNSIFNLPADTDIEAGAGGGIGLAITKRLVELMGGRIDFKSDYGSGTVFTVRLPVVMGNAGNAEEKNTFVRAKDGSVRALLADDTQMNLSVLKGLLNRHNISVDTAFNGQEALDMFKNNTYDIVFLDHIMPVMDGIEAARHIRSLAAEQAKVPIIAVSANNAQNADEIFINAGMNGFLPKPIDTEQLNVILSRFLNPDTIETTTQNKTHTPEDGGTDDILQKIMAIDGLDVAEGLRNIGSQKSEYFGILKDFCDELDEFAKIIHDDLDRKDWRDYHIRMHGLKGSFATIGQKKMSLMARRLEWGGKIAGGNSAAGCEFTWSKEEAKQICKDETAAVLNAYSDLSQKLRSCGL
ncbi:MAG: response regulator [Spirochaetaceae bacterium]|jgi:signal transduction histidine kinase/FixJ family two-component response regulator|nr:response regulator [Spirochaetaceae bacterium]